MFNNSEIEKENQILALNLVMQFDLLKYDGIRESLEASFHYHNPLLNVKNVTKHLNKINQYINIVKKKCRS